jgi:hypothetical protein
MTSVIISNTPPFGALTNQAVADLFTVNQAIVRLQAAVASAASGYAGTAGTEYEGNGTNFGVVASSDPGAQGAAYSFALLTLANAWTTFWNAALASIEELDNGVISP